MPGGSWPKRLDGNVMLDEKVMTFGRPSIGSGGVVKTEGICDIDLSAPIRKTEDIRPPIHPA